MRLSNLSEARITKGSFQSERDAKNHCFVCGKDIEPVFIKGRYGPNYQTTGKMETPDRYTLNAYIIDDLPTSEPLISMSRTPIENYSKVVACSTDCALSIQLYCEAAFDVSLKAVVDKWKPRAAWLDLPIQFTQFETPQNALAFKNEVDQLGYLTSKILVGHADRGGGYQYAVCILPDEGIRCESKYFWDYERFKGTLAEIERLENESQSGGQI